MRSIRIAMMVLAGLGAVGWSVAGNLLGAEQACIKYAGPAAQDDCRRQQKAALEAFERDRQKRAQDAAPAGEAAQKKRELCFTREGSGERVCPN